jgi:cytochrome c biogenesis protein CcmG/thiol:disulfide interchange protein DsbE
MRQSIVIKIAMNLVLLSLFAFSGGGTNEKAPLFSLKTLTGENYFLESNLGKGPIVISFWATWCGPCMLEMKKLKKTYGKYSSAGLQILAVSIDDNKTQPQIPSVIRTYKLPYTVLLDGNKDVYKAFHVVNVPQLFVVDAAGTIVYNHQGYQRGDEKKVEAIVARLVGDKK